MTSTLRVQSSVAPDDHRLGDACCLSAAAIAWLDLQPFSCVPDLPVTLHQLPGDFALPRGLAGEQLHESSYFGCWNNDARHHGEGNSFGVLPLNYLLRVLPLGAERDLHQARRVGANQRHPGCKSFPVLPALIRRLRHACRAFVNAWKRPAEAHS